jgi:DHA1 family inner membrane transport protein
MAIGAGAPLTTLPWVGVATSIGALVLTLWSVSIDRRAQRMAMAG